MNARDEISRGWARWTARNFRLRFPQYEAWLYEVQGDFILHSSIPSQELATLQAIFDRELRPVTCPIRLENSVPVDATLLDHEQSYQQELWLQDSPLSVPALNLLLGLADAEIPAGTLDADPQGEWVFRSFEPLDSAQRDRLRSAMKTLGFNADVRFGTEINRTPARNTGASTLSRDLSLTSSRARTLSQGVRELLVRDEDEWRTFLQRRGERELSQPPRSERGACLFDSADKSGVRLSELLTLYECVNLIPDHSDPCWMQRHGIDNKELGTLVELGRCKIVLPFPLDRYAPDMIEAIADVDSNALILSRTLATRTITVGQNKDPLLYAPFSASQKAKLLSLLDLLPQRVPGFEGVLSASYAAVLKNQHHGFMMNGATACLGSGIGAYLGELIYRMRGQDARLELGVAGASVEWALGLGSALIPRSFGEGYDETNNCHSVASFISRSRGKPVDPVAKRMHTVVDGLLALADVPATEVARNFNGTNAQRFRSLATRLLHEAPTQADMEDAVRQINAETRVFERRQSRLKKWKLDTAAVLVLTKPLADTVDERVGYYASTGAAWLYELLKDRMPSQVQEEIGTMVAIMQGLMLGSSLDAVIVSRSRAEMNSST